MKDHSRNHLTPADILRPADMLAVLTAMVRDDQSSNREKDPSDGPTERVIRQSDIDERREREYERWMDRDGRRAG